MAAMDSFVPTLAEWSEIFMQHSMRNVILYSRESGLSMSQIGALFRIFHKGNTAVSHIGEELGVTSAAASQMLERLVQQGLILRSEDPSDRRMKQLVLTDKGRQVLHECLQARQVWMEELVALLSPEEQDQIVAALNLIITKARLLKEHPECKP